MGACVDGNHVKKVSVWLLHASAASVSTAVSILRVLPGESLQLQQYLSAIQALTKTVGVTSTIYFFFTNAGDLDCPIIGLPIYIYAQYELCSGGTSRFPFDSETLWTKHPHKYSLRFPWTVQVVCFWTFLTLVPIVIILPKLDVVTFFFVAPAYFSLLLFLAFVISIQAGFLASQGTPLRSLLFAGPYFLEFIEIACILSDASNPTIFQLVCAPVIPLTLTSAYLFGRASLAHFLSRRNEVRDD